ncbi:hypothetical protein Y023_4746 [Burkholderia pseudomallei A79D]|nr:hypothetical protein DO72_5372 [Burkholderia pseudomallei]KGS25853.1 hypothetical protein X962_4523 [Burkholderia pseudomallei MSHR7343]KGS37962.1 hypothetical protein X945_5085 [Burkholderia pseudomallei ABCPW 107]KGS39946.1 hypothetical protein X992_5035 [Burkholderia pseudomallei MSHR5492]KGS88404.1 hypothetical protein X976_5674 [Burkholderia pseudomallei MSHR7500]KGX97271.1 hypothetical protein Y023_4746 [Burkholderia pseudomallei A79D]KGX98231.1 hypothetical protein X997_4503 [Burkho
MPRPRPTVRAALSDARAGLRRARAFFPSTDKSNGKRCEPTAAVRGDARRDPLRPARDGAPAAGTLFDCR